MRGYVERETIMGVIAKVGQEQDVRQVLLAFANSIQERDIVTYEHSRRVATYAQPRSLDCPLPLVIDDPEHHSYAAFRSRRD